MAQNAKTSLIFWIQCVYIRHNDYLLCVDYKKSQNIHMTLRSRVKVKYSYKTVTLLIIQDSSLVY